MLLALFTFFVVMILWVMFRPGASKTYSDVANIPFRHEDKPAPANTTGGEKEA